MVSIVKSTTLAALLPGLGAPVSHILHRADFRNLWEDLIRGLSNLFGRGGRGGGQDRGPEPGAGKMEPDMRGAGVIIGLTAIVVVLAWLGTGFFIVYEGQEAVITQFGRYESTVGAGFHWRLPFPMQRHEQVFVTRIRSVDVGRDSLAKATGLRDSAMLTGDENIVEVKFSVQYRLNDARAYLFESKDPSAAVVKAAETAVRQVVGRMSMDAALATEREQIAPRVRATLQDLLDSYKVGIDVVGINLQHGGVRPPQQVQSAFDDVLRAVQERERAKNEAQAYANDVIPRAVGAAARLKEEAAAYKSRIIAEAQGDAQRFKSVQHEYQRAPQVTRDRMYLETMQGIYSSVNKVLVDSRLGSSMLYMPLAEVLTQAGMASPPSGAATPPSSPASEAPRISVPAILR
jgi:modulator of FtsH protease HflK|uniref:FtsH protease activity modulator HflK n=1 Tax=uncultured Acidovorax sp. TaxID=158751 RepID=UPI0009E93A7A|nr:FtsH protease activity modulator HflK [uncultured Acidovorax sp.]